MEREVKQEVDSPSATVLLQGPPPIEVQQETERNDHARSSSAASGIGTKTDGARGKDKDARNAVYACNTKRTTSQGRGDACAK